MLTAVSPSAHVSAPVAFSPFFSCDASELLEALKGAEALRKSADRFGLLGASVFLSSPGAGLYVQAFHCLGNASALLAWLPSGNVRESFSLPLLPLLSFVKATKGKGSVSYSKGKLSASASGASLSLAAGPSLFDHPDQNEIWRQESYNLPDLSARLLPADSEGFPLSPFITTACFASKDEAKQALIGAGFYGQSFYGTDGYSLRKAPASLPDFPKAAAFPSEAWLPSWLASIVEAFAKPAKRESLLGFYFPARKGSQALRFCAPSGLSVVVRFPEAPGTFPKCDQLFPDRLPFYFTAETKAFLEAVEALLQALKASDGSPLIGLSIDRPIGEVQISAVLQKNVGTKNRPEMEDVGTQEASVRIKAAAAPADPSLDDAFWQSPESQQEMARAKFKHESTVLLNGFFLQKALKSFLTEGEVIRFAWKDAHAPVLLSAFVPESQALIMPVQKRR